MRERVARSKRKLEVGQRIRLYGREYVVAHVFPNGVYGIDNGSTMYRLKRSQIKDVEVIE